jgi:hypothetical protein
MKEKYYTAPSDEIFEEVKRASMKLWEERYPEETSHFYAKEKIDRIEEMENIEDNFMFIFSMFDIHNQRLLMDKLSFEARKEIAERIPIDNINK